MNQKPKSVYSRDALAWVRREAKRIPGVIGVRHIIPRAYCVAKPRACIAVFAACWLDAEELVRDKELSSSIVVENESAENIEVGEWCALAYCRSSYCGQVRAFKIED